MFLSTQHISDWFLYFTTLLYHDWLLCFQAHRNLSQLPNFSFSLALAYFLQAEGGDHDKADKQVPIVILYS